MFPSPKKNSIQESAVWKEPSELAYVSSGVDDCEQSVIVPDILPWTSLRTQASPGPVELKLWKTGKNEERMG